MRSAETSGADAEGFGVGKNAKDPGRVKASSPAKRRRFPQHISPITASIALTALLSAALFTIYDTARTFDTNQHQLRLIGATLASEIAELEPDIANAVVDLTTRRFAEVTRASLISAEGTPLNASNLLSQFVPAGPHGVLTVESSAASAWIGILQRSAIAFALAALLTALTWRPRKGGMLDLQQRHNYRTLASAIPLGVACWTRSGDLVICNDQYRERLHLGGKPVTYHDVVKRLIVGGYMKLLNDDANNRLLELHREDGSCLLIDERPLGDGGFMTLVSDVTERKKADTLLNAIREEQRLLARRYHEEKLKAEAASRAKTNFLAHLSHDIRTPLNHIIGFAELMRHQTYGPLGDPRYADYVQSIKTSGEHLLATFANILDLAELDSGQKALRSDAVAIDLVMANVAQRFTAQAERAGITFQLGQTCGAIVHGDRLGLTRMLANVVENSLRFTRAGGRITLAAFAAQDGVVVEITDTGIGMDEERLASLSQPFALGDATFTRDGIGPGLGISISRAIAELTGGRMAIDSSPSMGTTVAFSLPIRAQEQLQAA
ncbi:sensor histidine kinase [Devosia naphthalenivorans]|uniref:sensor histidine kinase n=1 Tax=Devosia naphthalenivorans TaxID=2082392 RepID=UPI000D37FA91|nr:PAS domain-containing sensor histidine kinase [Devosia naphthalenivorans]